MTIFRSMFVGALALATFGSPTASLAEEPEGPPPADAPAPMAPVAIAIEGADEHHEAIRQAILAELATSLEPDSPRRIVVKIGADDLAFTTPTRRVRR